MDRGSSEIRRGMRIDWDVPIPMDDGVVLRCDVYRPIAAGRYPVIMSYGPYGKWQHFEDGYPTQWRDMIARFPEVASDTSNDFQNWELVDPEKWVPDGYAVVRVDSRGAGRSPGVIDIWSAREARDFHHCIEWAGVQAWSSGKVGLNGISYFAENQWQVAALRSKHPAAICIWEGATDFYPDMGHHGGIFCNGFCVNWPPRQIYSVQHGRGANGPKSRMNGGWVGGDVTLSKEELAANRKDFGSDVRRHKLATDKYWTSRTPDWSKIRVPLLSTANWGGHGLHTRGNFEGWLAAGSAEKYLEVHGDLHWTHFYTNFGLRLQKRFFGHYLKGERTGWEKQPRVLLHVRHPGEKFVERAEKEWPLARTEWTKLYLDPEGETLVAKAPRKAAAVAYRGGGDGVTFLTPPMKAAMEVTGPVAARLFVSSTTEDADLFLVLRVFAPDMKEVNFIGAIDPHQPVSLGWLRASHRRLDAKKSMPYRPWHTHDKVEKLKPGQVYELDIEILPTSVVVPKGYRLGLSVRGRDYVYPGEPSTMYGEGRDPMTGVGSFRHDDPQDRPPAIFHASEVTLHAGPDRQAFLLLPVIPPGK